MRREEGLLHSHLAARLVVSWQGPLNAGPSLAASPLPTKLGPGCGGGAAQGAEEVRACSRHTPLLLRFEQTPLLTARRAWRRCAPTCATSATPAP